jgi:SNF family Na+-dependent transporter
MRQEKIENSTIPITTNTSLPNTINYAPAGAPQCGALFDNAFFTEIMVATIAEMPGLLASILLVDRIGRKRSQTLFFVIVTAVLFLLAIVPRTGGGDLPWLRLQLCFCIHPKGIRLDFETRYDTCVCCLIKQHCFASLD